MVHTPGCGLITPLGSEKLYLARHPTALAAHELGPSSFYYDRSTFSQPDSLNQKLEGFFVGRKGASIEETHLFGASSVNTVRLGWNYTQGFGELTPSVINQTRLARIRNLR
jgi:hypothetical protein